MSFLPSFNPLASSSSSSSQVDYRPATLSYFTIFCPALKPPKSKKGENDDDDDDPDNDSAREAAQILFYTSRARAALKDKMLRQIGVAKGMVEFCSMVSPTSASTSQSKARKNRSWNIHSSKRRMILVEVEEGIWVHASVDLPHTIRRSTSNPDKTWKEHHDSLLADEWLEESIKKAWRDWRLLNGSPHDILSRRQGRVGLERSLEKYFSVWAWSWDLEFATSGPITQSDASVGATEQRSVFSECIEGFPIVARAPRSKLAMLMRSSGAQKLQSHKGKERELIILSDISILWPPTNAGCLDDEAEEDADEPEIVSGPQLLDTDIKAELLRRVVSHLTGLEKEKDLVRAAAAASTSDGRRRGTSGAIRERSTANVNSKRDIRNGLLSASAGAAASKKRVVSSPVTQRSASGSSIASSLNDATKWSNWGSIFGGLGKLNFRVGGTETPERSSTPNSAKADAATNKASSQAVEATAEPHHHVTAQTSDKLPVEDRPAEARDAVAADQAPRIESASLGSTNEESPGPFQLIQQRLAEAIPIQDAGSKVWTGAESAFKGISSSLGFRGSASPSTDRTPAENSLSSASKDLDHKEQDHEPTDEDRFADASADISGNTNEADVSHVTKVSILEPEVDVEELAAALGTEAVIVEESQTEINTDSSTPNPELTAPVSEPIGSDPMLAPSHETTNSPALPALPERLREGPKSTEDGNSTDSASIRTGSSAKAFPSISVTSAAWYNAKSLKSDAATTVVTSSPKLAAALGESSGKRITSDAMKGSKGSDPEPEFAGDISLGTKSIQSLHHDFELDGWGHEEPAAFQSFKCFVGGSDEPVSFEDTASPSDPTRTSSEFRVSFCTRRLLTLILIEKVEGNQSTLNRTPDDTDDADEAWQLLRRLQRILNDRERAIQTKHIDQDTSVRFLHLDGPTLTFQSSLDTAEPKLEKDVASIAEAHCLSAMALMKRHDIVETFSRSSNGKTWTASRKGHPHQLLRKNGWKSSGEIHQSPNLTFMVLAGKKISIVDCDNELRKLANEYPSFGI